MKDLFLLLDSAILKGKGPPQPPTTSRHFPSTLTGAYMTENRSEKLAERGRKPTKDQGKTTQRKAATEKPPKQPFCRWKRRQQKNHPPEATSENQRPPLKNDPFCGRKQDPAKLRWLEKSSVNRRTDTNRTGGDRNRRGTQHSNLNTPKLSNPQI